MSRYAGEVIVDNPDADGAITTWGIGLDWPAREPRIDGRHEVAGTGTVDLEGEYGWLLGDQAEYISGLGAIGPRGAAEVDDMSLDDWTVEWGDWKETRTFAGYQKTWLHYYNGYGLVANHEDGQIWSKAGYVPAIRVWIWHMPPIPYNGDPCLVDIAFEGDGLMPSYILRLPRFDSPGGAMEGDDRVHRYPTLYGKRPGGSSWSVVDEIRTDYAATGMTHLDRPELQMVTIEYDSMAKWLMVRLGYEHGPHLFRGSWRDEGDHEVPFALTDGPIGLRVCGHTALLNVQQLAYPSPVTVRPTLRWNMPPRVQSVSSYRMMRSAPSGVTMEGATDAAGNASRPAITFSSSASARRGLLWNVQEYREPEFGAANPEPLSTEDGDTLQLMEMSGECSDRWRGGRLSATLMAAPEASLAEVRSNQKIIARVSDDEGENWTTLFTGYAADDPEISREDGSGRETLHLSARDGIEGRLPKKIMWGHCSYEDWPVGDAFEHILQRAGVPDALISVDAAIAGVQDLPFGTGGERLLAFRGSERVETALDQIATIRGLQWGVDQSGSYFLRPMPTHTAGAYDHTIDLATSDPDDLVMAPFRHAQDMGEFANMMVVMVGQGWRARGGWFWDPASIEDPTSERYVGEDWWELVDCPDGDSAQAIYDALWQRRLELSDAVYWQTLGHAEIMPGEHVRVLNAGCGLTSGSIFRVSNKAWRLEMDEDNGVYSASYEGVLVETA